ncbi:FAD binding domain-containing protein [Desarmillaria tabescens]|uniref:FAD binding domain-containing protein n=1 Tax=Armillaria tabescens TaxID=1929756 RepID=A0AA39T601_ARMTA|nr:FAD binding domain-containing protein [Desarmillaria tabescens]KAK0466826.1 FAD binding domain-containing protein [Desarmillaria tabescens]
MTAAVLIVGAGPSGLSLALALQQNGVSVRIIDKLATYRVGQKGSGIQPRILELYKLLGVLPDIQKKAGVPQPKLQYLPGGATKVETLAFMENTPDRPYINPIMLGQDRHEEILREHLARYGVTVELGTELVSFEQFPDQVVSRIVKTRNGQQYEESVESRWLVGAEGAHSVVRKTLGLTFLGETRKGDNLVVGDIHVKKPLLDRDVWHVWGEPGTKAVTLRPFETKDDKYTFICMGRGLDAAKMSSGRDEFIKEFYETSGRTDIEFGDLIWISNFQPNVRMVNSYGSGRAFVTGDSAHVHSPTGGQGLNSGIQDSVNLAWKLALIEKGLAPQSLLDTYSQERIPVIAAMLDKTSELLTKTFKPGGASRAGWARGYELRQLGVNYRASPVIVDETPVEGEETVDPYQSGNDGTIRGGDRAPDAPGLVFVNDSSRKTSLFDIFSPSYHTVLIFSDENAAVLDALKSYPAGTVKSVVIVPQQPTGGILADYVLVDGEGYAYKHYNIAEKVTKVVVVRPDGIIGALVVGVDGLKQYFKGIFV